MIGVAFVLAQTFGKDVGTERAAFEHALRTLARMRGWRVDETRLDHVVNGTTWDFAPGTNLIDAFSAALGPTLSRELAGVPLEALVRMAGARCVADHFVPYDDVAPTLRELAAMSVPCVVMSAGWSSIEERKAEAVGFHGPLLLGEDLDVPLMSPRAFARVAETLKLPADRIWFVGTDASKEILPARAAGMHAVWLNRNNAEFPALREPPDVTITTFAALLEALSEPYTRGLLAMRHILRTVLDWRPGHFLSGADPILGDDEPTGAG